MRILVPLPLQNQLFNAFAIFGVRVRMHWFERSDIRKVVSPAG